MINKTYLTILLCFLPFPGTLADEVYLDKTEEIQPPINHCTTLSIKQKNGERYQFCMASLDQQKVSPRNAPSTEKIISLFAGDNLSINNYDAMGNLSFSIKEYQLSDTPYLINEKLVNIPAGSFGQAPTNFKLYEIGENNFGYIIEDMAIHQGIQSGGIYIIGEHKGKVFHQYIPTSANHAEDASNTELISYSMKIQDHQTTNVFPIEIILNGQYDGKVYQDQSFILTFNEKKQQYMIPENYPVLH